MIGILTPEQKAKDLIDYFWKKYGPERAEIICKKIAPGFNTESFSDLIKTGEKWHYFNLL